MPNIALSEMTDADVCCWMANTKFPAAIKDAFRGLTGNDLLELVTDWGEAKECLPTGISHLQSKALKSRIERLEKEGWHRNVPVPTGVDGSADVHGKAGAPAAAYPGTTEACSPLTSPPRQSVAGPAPASVLPETTTVNLAAVPSLPSHVAVQVFQGQTTNAVAHTTACSPNPGGADQGLACYSLEQVDPEVAKAFALYMQNYRQEKQTQEQAYLIRDGLKFHRGVCKVCPKHTGVRFTGYNFYQFQKHFNTTEHRKHYKKLYGGDPDDRSSAPKPATIQDAAHLCDQAATKWEVTVDEKGSVYVLHTQCGTKLRACSERQDPGAKKLTPKQLQHNMSQHANSKGCGASTKKRRVIAQTADRVKFRKVMTGPLMSFMGTCSKQTYIKAAQKKPVARPARQEGKELPEAKADQEQSTAAAASPCVTSSAQKSVNSALPKSATSPSPTQVCRSESTGPESCAASQPAAGQPKPRPPQPAGDCPTAEAQVSTSSASSSSSVSCTSPSRATLAQTTSSVSSSSSSARAAGPPPPPRTNSLVDHAAGEESPESLN